jgi:3-oxoacyl-[acyl-carrier protein] reductase
MMNERIAWILGGSRGIGFACAEALVREGYRIALSTRNKDELNGACKRLTLNDTIVKAFPCNIADEASVKATYQAIIKEFGAAPHVLINSAGISPWSTFSETSIAEFDRVIATNTLGVFLTSREVLPAMYERGEGAIVQILSIAAIKGFKNGAAYVASKFAALGFTNALREEARAHGVHVIAVLPGATETELWDEDERTKYHERMMQPEDIAEAVVSALRQPQRTLIEEIILRPIGGDL